MKTLLVSSLSIIALAVIGTGCVKDKDYENQSIGTQVPGSHAVSFPQSKGTGQVAYSINSQSAALTIKGPLVAMEAPGPESSDTHVTLQINEALVTADPLLTVLPATEYSLDPNRTILSGGMFDSIAITINNSANLDPSKTYGIGLTISSADNGFEVASNMKDIVLKIVILNQYDGVYNMTGHHNRPPASSGGADYTFPYINVPMSMITVGPSDIAYYWNEADDYGHPFGIISGLGWYGPTVAPIISFNDADYTVANVYNSSSAGPPIGLYNGPLPTTNYYDPLTKTIYVAWEYNNNPDRAFFDTLVYVQPR